jgi:hypothetical protein
MFLYLKLHMFFLLYKNKNLKLILSCLIALCFFSIKKGLLPFPFLGKRDSALQFNLNICALIKIKINY